MGGEESASFVVSSEPVAVSSKEDPPPELIYKDAGSSDSSNSSDILNGENSPGQGNLPPAHTNAAAGRGGATSSVPVSSPQLPFKGQGFVRQMLKLEEEEAEEEFLGREDPFSSLFSDEQPPALHWFFSDHWNWK